ncbi:MAG: lysostaphin resistance A-like protein [Candidatus Thorarchaeota archaeon]
MDDPDFHDMDEYYDIEIYEPGKVIEREVNWDVLFRVLLLTGVGFALTFGITFALELPLLLFGFIDVNYFTGQIEFAPWVLILLTFAELGFIIPPIWYARRNGFGLDSLGIKIPRRFAKRVGIQGVGDGADMPRSVPVAFTSSRSEALKDIALGLGFGVLMLISNIIITWIVTLGSGAEIDDSVVLFQSSDVLELIGWIVVMFLIVGFSEELLFRGFLQRRMEIFFRSRSTNFKMIALVITSAIFSIMHLDLLGFAARFVLGLFLGYLAARRQYSILGPTVAHGFNNAAVVVFAFLGF